MATTITPYVSLEGTCEEAMKFWAETLGAELDIRRVGDSPIPAPPEAKNRVMHSTLKAGNLVLMASDNTPGMPAEKGSAVSLSLHFTDKDEQTRVWSRLSQGATIMVPLDDQFWGRFGMLTDKFGIKWMLNLDASK